MTTNIRDVLSARQGTHGDYSDHARVTQNIKAMMHDSPNWTRLHADQIETLDMLAAMSTGHAGSLTTVHANSPRDVLSRIEVMTMMAGIEMPVIAIREQIASAALATFFSGCAVAAGLYLERICRVPPESTDTSWDERL